ncbi:MAG: hypothetical protein JKY95_01535 [Planctomycetaceae bacterium]|nr:hypothetical protein [Planctomycetaceae bacterium]
MLALLPAGLDANATDLAEAKQRLAEWEQKIVSMRVRAQVNSKPETNTLVKEAGYEFAGGDYDWAWEDTGRFRDQSTSWNSSGIATRSLRMADYKHYYPLGYSATDKKRETPISAAIRENNIRFTSLKLIQQPFHGLWDDTTRTWLGERIKNVTNATVTKQGLLEIDGSSIGMERFIVRLDPEHGYLPQSIEQEGFFLYHVDEFQEVEPGFWFPKTGSRLTTSAGYSCLQNWEIKEVELNPEFPDSLFVPPLADDTRVFNTITGRKYWHGGKRPANLPLAPDPQDQDSSQANENPLAATADQSTNWSMWLILIGVASVAGAVWMRRTS